MRTPPLLAIGACLLAHLATSQSRPAPYFMIGPTVGFDRITYANTAGYVGSPSYNTPTGINFGVDASYQVSRLLIGAKLLYRQQLYQVTPSKTLFYDSGFPSPYDRVYRTDTDLQVLTVPVTVGYRLTGDSRFQWYIGGTVAADYLLGSDNPVFYDKQGAVLPNIPPNSTDFGRSLNIGYGAQTTLRYQLKPGICLQLEPALRYYPTGGFPTKIYSTYQFQSTFSLLVKV